MGIIMFQTSCTECGATEDEGVVVQRIDQENRENNPSRTISEDLHTVFYCSVCDLREKVETGILPEKHTAHFESKRVAEGERLTVLVDGREIPFQSVDEQVSENAYYSPEGVRSTSRIHHVHIHAKEPPTVSKGKHRIEVGDWIDAQMILGDVRYHNSGNRTLKFFRSLGGDVMEPLDKSAAIEPDAPVGQE